MKKTTRRKFFKTVVATGTLAVVGSKVLGSDSYSDLENISKTQNPTAINRFALVNRHNPVLKKIEPLSPLSVGNGEFAFTCDVTGLQTFPDEYKNAMPLCTMSQWGWHTIPHPKNLTEKDLRLADFDTYGRKVSYHTSSEGQKELFDWLRENPHRLHLGQIGLRILKASGTDAQATDIKDIEQTLDIWKGIITSNFKVEGKTVTVKTAVHPTLDLLAVSIESNLINDEKLSVKIAFPYGSSTMQAVDWQNGHRPFFRRSVYPALFDHHQDERPAASKDVA